MRISKFYVVLLFLGLGSCLVVRNFNAEKERLALEEREADHVEEIAHQNNLKAMVAKYEANYQWYKQLERPKKGFQKPIMQANLEDWWVSKKPIVFVGRISDYKNDGLGRYKVKIKPVLLSAGMSRSLRARLDISAPKDVIDRIVSQHPAALSSYPRSKAGAVVVVARINAIEPRWEGAQDDDNEALYGLGDMIDIYFVDGTIVKKRKLDIF